MIHTIVGKPFNTSYPTYQCQECPYKRTSNWGGLTPTSLDMKKKLGYSVCTIGFLDFPRINFYLFASTLYCTLWKYLFSSICKTHSCPLVRDRHMWYLQEKWSFNLYLGVVYHPRTHSSDRKQHGSTSGELHILRWSYSLLENNQLQHFEDKCLEVV